MNRIKLILPSINQRIHNTHTQPAPIPNHSEWHEKGNVSLGPEWGDCFFFAEPTTHYTNDKEICNIHMSRHRNQSLRPIHIGHHWLAVGDIRSWLASLCFIWHTDDERTGKGSTLPATHPHNPRLCQIDVIKSLRFTWEATSFVLALILGEWRGKLRFCNVTIFIEIVWE